MMSELNSSVALLFQSASLWSQLIKRADSQLSVHGISFTEFSILHCLAQAPLQQLSRIELANTVGLSASGVTRLLLPLEKIHLVEKAQIARDARVSLVKLTSTGMQIYQDALPTLSYCAEQFTSPLTSRQQEQLSDLLGRLS
jgi:DNA-binding MarR family transcriptional regulator